MENKETPELINIEQEWDAVDEGRRANRKDCWDRRASGWEEGLRSNEIRRRRYNDRISATMDWLKSFGLFLGDCDVADIGCGPGRFVAEFAEKSRYVLGVDISPRMIEYGNEYLKQRGFHNTELYTGDFTSLDIKALGWEKRFDLAFSSITPAIKGKSGVDNLIGISRAWCYNSCFVYFSNELHDKILTELFQMKPNREKTSHSYWFKQLFDLLWLRGYHPHVNYYKDHRDESVLAEWNSAEDLARYLLGEDAVDKKISIILRYLERNADQDGRVFFTSSCWFGWLLWNVNDRIAR